MKYKFIVFDWDGTLMNSIPHITNCLRSAIKDTGLPHRSDDSLYDIIGLGLRDAIDKIYPGIDLKSYQLLVDNFRQHFLITDNTPSILFDGAITLLDALQQQEFYLGVATGKGRTGLNQALNETATADYFHATRCADEAFSKPHPQMLQDLISEMGVTAAETLMIGDTEYDLQMAANAGCDAVAITHGAHTADRLKLFNPIACVDNLVSLHNFLHNCDMHAANE